MSGALQKARAHMGMTAVLVSLLTACAAGDGAGSTSSEPAVSATQEPSPGTRDYADFAVAQSVVQESIEELSSAAIGSGSEGLARLKSALDETGPTADWCSAVQAGVDALEFARSRAQAEELASAATAQEC